jgi:hypothetical protein
VKAPRKLLNPALGTALVPLMVALLGGVALSATEVSQTDSTSSFQAEADFLQDKVRSFHAEVLSLEEGQPTPEAQEERAVPRPALLADIPQELPITARPGKGKVIGRMPAGSRYFGEPHTAWIQDRSSNGRFGKVAVPYSGTRATGWIRIAGLDLSHTPFRVRIDVSRHLVTVLRLDKVIMSIPAATGAPASRRLPAITSLPTSSPLLQVVPSVPMLSACPEFNQNCRWDGPVVTSWRYTGRTTRARSEPRRVRVACV